LRNALKINSAKIIKVCLLAILITLSSCFGIKQAGGNSGPSHKLYEIFYLEGGTIQYFAKPQSLLYNNSDAHSYDLLFRKKDNKSDSITINLTAYTLNELTKETKPSLSGTNTIVPANDFSIIYTEKSEDNFKNRVSFKLPYITFLKIIKNNSFSILLETKEGEKITLSTSKKANKSIEELKSIFLY